MAFLPELVVFLAAIPGFLYRVFPVVLLQLLPGGGIQVDAEDRGQAHQVHEYVGQFVLHRLGGVGMARGVFDCSSSIHWKISLSSPTLAGQGHDQVLRRVELGPVALGGETIEGGGELADVYQGGGGAMRLSRRYQGIFRAGGEAGPQASATPLPATILPSDEGRKIVGILHGIGGYKLSDMPGESSATMGFCCFPAVQEFAPC